MDSKTKNNLILTCLILASLALLGAVGWYVYFKMTFNVYHDTTYKFDVKYLKSWKVIKAPSPGVAVVFQSPSENALDVFQENINISIQDVPSQIASLKSYSDTITRQMTAVFKNNIKIPANKDMPFAGRNGHLLIFETTNTDQLRTVIVWTIKESKAYMLTFMGRFNKFDALKPSLDEIISSFRFN